jgi:hypothetical protein
MEPSMKAISLLAAFAAALLALPANAKVKFHSNAVKYKDSGAKPATGRSGSATLAARVLISKDATATLELTTGSFDPATSAGSIEKVQIKSKSTGTVNYNRLDNNGTFSTTLDGAARGDSFRITAHVKGIDKNRTGVVTVATDAHLRPDLTVTQIDVAPSVVLGASTVINATIRELNGDLGARANCVLRVNGTNVDSATGIWVDAAGTVSCSFLHTFAAAGTANIEVALTNVNPADYDDANNVLRRTVNVTATVASGMGRWSAGATEDQMESYSREDYSWGYHREYRNSGWTQSSSFTANWGDNLDLSTLKASYTEKTDDTTIVEMRDIPLQRVNGNGTQCLETWTDVMVVRICQSPGTTGSPGRPARPKFINPYFNRRAGDSTYLSKEWGKPTPDAPESVYVENSGGYQEGAQVRFGSTVTMEIEISDATRYYVERPFMMLEPSTKREQMPYSCPDPTWCRESYVNRFYKIGRATSPGY